MQTIDDSQEAQIGVAQTLIVREQCGSRKRVATAPASQQKKAKANPEVQKKPAADSDAKSGASKKIEKKRYWRDEPPLYVDSDGEEYPFNLRNPRVYHMDGEGWVLPETASDEEIEQR